VHSRASVAPNVRLAASGEGEGGSSCFFLTWFLREEDLAVRGDDTGIVGPLCRLPSASALNTATAAPIITGTGRRPTSPKPRNSKN
jgi:hypothetical protein